MCLRCVFDKNDPVIHDLGFLLAYKDLQTPERCERVEEVANNLMTLGKAHIFVKLERELASHASLVRDRVRWRTRDRTGVLPPRPPVPLRCWEVADAIEFARRSAANQVAKEVPEELPSGCSVLVKSKTRKIDFSSSPASSAAVARRLE